VSQDTTPGAGEERGERAGGFGLGGGDPGGFAQFGSRAAAAAASAASSAWTTSSVVPGAAVKPKRARVSMTRPALVAAPGGRVRGRRAASGQRSLNEIGPAARRQLPRTVAQPRLRQALRLSRSKLMRNGSLAVSTVVDSHELGG
jgi:hypothetical protein